MAKTLSLGSTPKPTPTIADTLRAILAEVTPGTRPFSGDSYLPDHLIEAARAALTSHDQAETPASRNAKVTQQVIDALHKVNSMVMAGGDEAAIELERNKARLILAGLAETNVADTAAQQHAHNALSMAAWHCARGEAPQALARLRRAHSHITTSMGAAA